jgi:predicted lipoprotein with Yx(FWY)xxD motif
MEIIMRHPKMIIAGIGLAIVATVGSVTAASAGATPAGSAPSAVHGAAPTVRTASVTVAGMTETILVNAGGLPLYYYASDTGTRSLVAGGLAHLWPPLTSAAAPAAAGLTGRLSVLNDVNGHQVTYNGHPLYTFADDSAGHVTGQGVQDFFVATPGLAAIGHSKPAGSAAAIPSSGQGY